MWSLYNVTGVMLSARACVTLISWSLWLLELASSPSSNQSWKTCSYLPARFFPLKDNPRVFPRTISKGNERVALSSLLPFFPPRLFALESHSADFLSSLVIDCKQGCLRLKPPLLRILWLCVLLPVTFYSLGSVAGSGSNNYSLYMINLKPSCSILSQPTH